MSRHVLLVDDDPAVRLVACALLQSKGFRVTEARDGIEALEHFAADRYDLVLLDCHMPRLDGAQTRSRILAMRPAQPIVMMSTEPPEALRSALAGNAVFLSKPFDACELIATVDAAA